MNSGLGSIRDPRLAEESFSRVTFSQQHRLTGPMVWRYGQMVPTSWVDAVSLVADVTRRVIDEMGEDGVIVSAYDHGGAGEGRHERGAGGRPASAGRRHRGPAL